MDIERKELIVKEIKYWKESKLLPKEYCDFLLMLYTQGEELNESRGHKKQLGSLWIYIDFLFLLLLLPLSAYFILSNTFEPWLRISFIMVTLAVAILHYAYFKKVNLLVSHLPMIIIFLTLLTGSLALISIINLNLNYFFIVLFHCLLWILIGFWKKLSYLMVSGLVGTLILLVNYIVI